MCIFCHLPCGQREFCDSSCYQVYKEAQDERNASYAEELPVGENRVDTFDEPPEFDVAGGL
jgi:hypothetical protein